MDYKDLFFWNKTSVNLDSQVTSVNKIFLKLIEKLDKILEKANCKLNENNKKIEELNSENNAICKIQDKINQQKDKYQSMLVD